MKPDGYMRPFLLLSVVPPMGHQWMDWEHLMTEVKQWLSDIKQYMISVKKMVVVPLAKPTLGQAVI